MDTSRNLWRTGQEGVLWSQAAGYRLVVEGVSPTGHVKFTVQVAAFGWASAPVLVCIGTRKTATEAMVAAEQAADCHSMRTGAGVVSVSPSVSF